QLIRPRQVALDDLTELTDAVDAGALTEVELDRIRYLDLLVAGGDKASPGHEETLLAGKVSCTINENDVERAALAASILRHAGYRARGFVGGYRIHPSTRAAADRLDLIVDLHRPPSPNDTTEPVDE